MRSLPKRAAVRIGFAHPSYALSRALAARAPDLEAVDLRSLDMLEAQIENLHVLGQSSTFWNNRLISKAKNLALIQSLSVGINHYDLEALRAHGIRLTNAQGCVDIAVAEHALGLMLMFSRKLHQARDNQAKRVWRPMINSAAERETELNASCLLLIGLGHIGTRLAGLAKGFGMHVIALRHDPRRGAGPADEVHSYRTLHALLPRADFVALTCPLTQETEHMIDAEALARLKPTAILVNVARGRVVDESALIAALANRRLAGAGLDCFSEEPLAPDSPLWRFANVVITPHAAGETNRYEARLVDLLLDNLERLWRLEPNLKNAIV